MPRKNTPIPYIPLKFEEAVSEFVKVKLPRKWERQPKAKRTMARANSSR